MINMDSPRHTRVRMIVNRAFTPRMVARIDDDVRVKARAIVAAMADRGECDIVTDLAAPLPLQIICEMMGIPNEEWHHIFEMTNIILGDETTTPDLETLMGAILTLAQIAQAVGEDRLANPQDDLVSAMMHAEVDGETLTPSEMASFFILLAAAGNETTRNAITHGIKALTDHPDQRAIWQADPENVSRDGGRGDRPMGHAGDPLPPHRHPGHQDRRGPHRGGREGRDVVRVGQS